MRRDAQAKAGASARRKFRAERARLMRKNWRDWLFFTALATAALVTTIVGSGAIQVIAAAVFGFTVAIAIVGWIIGGEVHSLRHVWGAIGEEATAEALGRLDGSSWYVTHDIAWRYGNFDHVVIGPPGVFLLDSKRLFSTARVENDELRSGNLRYKGVRMRGAARALHEALTPHSGRPPWVQAVVVVWDELDHETREENDVVYVEGKKLVPWLVNRPAKLAAERTAELAEAVEQLRVSAAG